jgi:hypothetical protein
MFLSCSKMQFRIMNMPSSKLDLEKGEPYCDVLWLL